MTDVPTTHPTAQRSSLQRPGIPGLRIGASLAAISVLLGDAFKMAYVDPYVSRGRQAEIVPKDDPEGRDPSW